MHEWTRELDTYLRVFITLEGRGKNPPIACRGRGSSEPCPGEPLYRCICCDNNGLICSDCMKDSHRLHPLHRVEVCASSPTFDPGIRRIAKKWNGSFFKRTLLKTLGLRIQLGHPPGGQCNIPEKGWNDDFVLIASDMIHSVGLDYCGCGHSGKTQIEQRLKRRYYPATVANPKTAATFRSLEMFEMLQYESKLTLYEFYNTLSRLTDNTGLRVPKVSGCSIQFLREKLSTIARIATQVCCV